MKNLEALLLPVVLLAAQNLMAQSAHLKLSTEYPAAGEKITLTYDAAGSVIDGKKPEATAYFIEPGYPNKPIEMTQDGKSWKGDLTVSAAAKAFFIKIASGKVIDNNNEKGYIYLLYKDKQPIEGTYAANAFILSSGIGNAYAQIKTENEQAIALYKKEFQLYPKSEASSLAPYYMLLARTPAYVAEVSQKATALQQSNDEKDLVLATSLLRALKKVKQADSLGIVIKAKFPNGQFAKNDFMNSIAKEPDAAKKEALFTAFIAKYPETPANVQDMLRLQLVVAYLKALDNANYEKQISKLTTTTNLPNALNSVAWTWAEEGKNLSEAEKASKRSLDLVNERINDPALASAKNQNQGAYDMFADTYAYILLKENKNAEALKYQEPVYEHTKGNNAEINEHYVQILNAAGQNAKALEIAEKSIKAGKTSGVLQTELKTAYTKVKGNDAGYDAYWAAIEKFNADKLNSPENLADKELKKKELAKQMINEPAPLFTLKDLSGKLVSLKDLKGKTVIIDYWATWCGPCKASFPGMQMAVNNYKNDPNVVFLFIDTWETGDNYLPGVKKFIADNKYSFHVLMDEKGTDNKQSKVVSSYNVDGIPTKFIIDKNGNIRFKYVGFSGTSEAVVNEVTAMIELLNTSNVTTTGQKVSMNK